MSIFISRDRRQSVVRLPSLVLTPVGAATDTASRWESIPSHEDLNCDIFAAGDAATTIGELSKPDEEVDLRPVWKQPRKMIKILAPHVLLITALLFYTAFGAGVLLTIEDEPDIEKRRAHFESFELIYVAITNSTWKTLEHNKNLDREEWAQGLRSELLKLSSAHEGIEDFRPDMPIYSRWTFPSAVLYTLTVLTTCGYGWVEPQTTGGKLFMVAFALLGIPLMFITAADIGKFLSDWVLRFWGKTNEFVEYLALMKQEYFPAKKSLPSSRKTSNSSSRRGLPSEDQELLELLEDERQQRSGLWFPIGAYVVMVCGYCAIGACLYMSWEHEWTFIYAFHFAFNLITTVGLGSVVVEHVVYLVLNVAYVILGLAVVTMCVDLASSQLKAYFTKLHYSGRAHARFMGLSEDVRGMMQNLITLRRGKGARLSLADIKALLAQQQLSFRPFCPRHMHMWRYIDETHSNFSTGRQNSFKSDVMCASLNSLRQQKESYRNAPLFLFVGESMDEGKNNYSSKQNGQIKQDLDFANAV